MCAIRSRLVALTIVLATASSTLGGSMAPPPINLKQYTYQTVRTPPFNGQLAFYAPDIVSSGKEIRLPLVVQILIGNGKRPFATDDGTMKPQEFNGYLARLLGTRAVRAIPFRIQKRGERLTFQYLSRSYVVTATELIACSGCADRVVLTVQPELRP
jgi:hypothetical protein